MPDDISLGARTVAALGGSLVTCVVVNPLDVIRVRMQQGSAMEHSAREFWYSCCEGGQCANSATGTEQCKKSFSNWNMMRTIIRTEGFTALWRGLPLQLVQAVPSNVIYFLAYENLRDHQTLRDIFGGLNPLLCGGLARTVASGVVSPLELIKTRLQGVPAAGSEAWRVVLKSCSTMVKVEGFQSLWSGLGLTLWRDVPFSSVYWLMVEGVRSLFPPAQTKSDIFRESFIAGCISGMAAAALTTPFDVGKTRRQLGGSECMSRRLPMLPFLTQIAHKEGWRALFVGLVPRTLKVAPACGIMITSYEMGKNFLKI